jgi:hypothetical protein
VVVLAGSDGASAQGAAALVSAIGARGRRVLTSSLDGPPPVHLVGYGPGVQAAAALTCAAPDDIATLALVTDGTHALTRQLAEDLLARPVPITGLDSHEVLPPADPDGLADGLSSFWDRWEDEETLLDVTLPGESQEVSRARRLVRAAMETQGLSARLSDDAELLTSELVTNALVHATPPVRVRVSTRADAVSVTVHDAGPASAPVPRHHHGRGLAIVAGTAARCGQWTGHDGTTTWFWLTRDQASTTLGSAPGSTSSTDGSGLAEEPALGSNASHGATAGAASAPCEHESR